jgi:hypothetical protein
MYMESTICRPDGVCLSQVSTSGMTAKATVLAEPKIFLFVMLWYYVLPRMAEHWQAYHGAAFLGKNYAVVRFADGKLTWTPRLDPDLPPGQAAAQLLFDLMPYTAVLSATIVTSVLGYAVLTTTAATEPAAA